ncbi:MAG: DNA polymerase I [Candidatus Dormibacteraceae bacterium]
MARGGRRGRLVLLDAHSLIYRAFFALPPMSTRGGEVTNAVYGFVSMLAIVLASRPEFAAAAFDLGGPTFRSEEYAEYKQGRAPMPDDLRPQIQRVREVLETIGIPIHSQKGFEADDIIGTLARKAEEGGMSVTIVSGDLDCLQLVTGSVEALVPRRGITDTFVYGPDQVRQRYGLEPPQLIDYKALRGDTSDNIPGVPGVGDKTAARLIREFGSVESLLERLQELPGGRLRTNLEAGAEGVRLAKRMVTIRRDAPVELDAEASRWARYDLEKVRRLFDDLEFRQLADRLPPPDIAPVQPTLTFEPAVPGDGPEVVTDRARLAQILDGVGRGDELALFGLWDGSALHPRMAGLGLATASAACYVPVAHEGLEPQPLLPLDDLVGPLRAVLERAALLCHDAKEMDLAVLALGLGAPRWAFDTYLSAYLLGAGARDPRLDDLAREFLGMEVMGQVELLGSGRSSRPASRTGVADAARYAGRRAQAIVGLRPRLQAELRNLGVDYLFWEIELPLARLLAGMEWRGVGIDVPYLGAMSAELAAQLASIDGEVARVVGQTVNLNAPQQLAKLLFEDLRLPAGKRTKTGYSTDADTLESLRDKHPVVGLILENRQLAKLKSTYVDALPTLVDASGRVHTSWNQAVTATGRLSSSSPNLMNIPIRTELGQRIRRAFRAGEAGHVLFAADYSQIELRIAAHLSQDPRLLASFAAGQDIHAATAAQVFKVPIEAVTADQRRLAKVANFGSLYGQGEYGLALQMGIPGDEARQFLKDYFGNYARLKEFLDEIRNQARETGVVVSATGRRRAIPDLRSPNFQLRQAADRMAINFPIQSLAADIIKIAMVRLDAEMAAAKLAGRMTLQVHDELVFELPENEVEAFAEMVPRVMVGAYELQSGLAVEARAGRNWADLAPLPGVRV